jgi:membrane associated rhomboid family serine protease
MIALVVIFALQCVNDVYLKTRADTFLGLTPLWLLRGWVWQLFTFQVLHVDILHIVCNLVGLWFFGSFVESVVGRHRFLLFFFGCGLMGGLLQGVLMVLFPNHFTPFVFGASAGTSAMFAIFARLESESEVRWNFIIPVRAQMLLWISMGISLFFTLVPSGRGGSYAHAAHLGGMLAALGIVRLGWHRDFVPLPWEVWWEKIRNRQRSRPAHRLRPFSRKSSVPQPVVAEEIGSEEFISKEVDPILDKISAHGIHSLTERERKILERARERMAKR